jgi:glycerol-3-phosphate dehydrogenase
MAQPLVAGYPAIRAEVAYSARNEMAATLDDVLGRRTGLEFFSWEAAMAAAPVVAAVMQREMGWDSAQARRAVDEYRGTISDWMEKIGLAKHPAKA